ncbi:MAG: GNAT family N-acetyltransferase [Clostridiales bacterium]|jgi:ribosomal protein S18 acetylase RimI-like enzyme|nr:GNAT family N-acetyltransferase [Clostridiales bacterium]
MDNKPVITIKPYEDKYRHAVQKICIDNAGHADKPLEAKRYILIMYCNYYIEQEPENCFVAVNENDEAVGYIICSEDYKKYRKIFNKRYIPQARTISFKKYCEAKLDMLSHALWMKNYPAHLHIDIDSNYQRLGIGTRLMDALINHLKAKGVKPGLMLVVGATNEQGRNFYKKYGFKELAITKMGVAMGIDL